MRTITYITLAMTLSTTIYANLQFPNNQQKTLKKTTVNINNTTTQNFNFTSNSHCTLEEFKNDIQNFIDCLVQNDSLTRVFLINRFQTKDFASAGSTLTKHKTGLIINLMKSKGIAYGIDFGDRPYKMSRFNAEAVAVLDDWRGGVIVIQSEQYYVTGFWDLDKYQSEKKAFHYVKKIARELDSLVQDTDTDTSAQNE